MLGLESNTKTTSTRQKVKEKPLHSSEQKNKSKQYNKQNCRKEGRKGGQSLYSEDKPESRKLKKKKNMKLNQYKGDSIITLAQSVPEGSLSSATTTLSRSFKRKCKQGIKKFTENYTQPKRNHFGKCRSYSLHSIHSNRRWQPLFSEVKIQDHPKTEDLQKNGLKIKAESLVKESANLKPSPKNYKQDKIVNELELGYDIRKNPEQFNYQIYLALPTKVSQLKQMFERKFRDEQDTSNPSKSQKTKPKVQAEYSSTPASSTVPINQNQKPKLNINQPQRCSLTPCCQCPSREKVHISHKIRDAITDYQAGVRHGVPGIPTCTKSTYNPCISECCICPSKCRCPLDESDEWLRTKRQDRPSPDYCFVPRRFVIPRPKCISLYEKTKNEMEKQLIPKCCYSRCLNEECPLNRSICPSKEICARQICPRKELEAIFSVLKEEQSIMKNKLSELHNILQRDISTQCNRCHKIRYRRHIPECVRNRRCCPCFEETGNTKKEELSD